MVTYVRLMALKHRSGWGYERLVRQVADSFHLLATQLPSDQHARHLRGALADLVDLHVGGAAGEGCRRLRRERGFRPRMKTGRRRRSLAGLATGGVGAGCWGASQPVCPPAAPGSGAPAR
jgi:hypothetical protein